MRPISTLFRDILLAILCSLIAILMLVIIHMGNKNENTADIESPSQVSIYITWPDELDTDVDLWIRGPDGIEVGYSNRDSILFSLLRDDLGQSNDILQQNFENIFGRNLLPGLYTVNIHLYRNKSQHYPIEVRHVVFQKPKGQKNKKVHDGINYLRLEGEEHTILNFEVEEDGQINMRTLNEIQRRFRT